MSKIYIEELLRNFSFATKENPIIGPLTKSQLFYMVLFGGVQTFILISNFASGGSLFVTLLFLFLSVVGIGAGHVFASKIIDGRNIKSYLQDKFFNNKVLIERRKQIKMNQLDIDAIIEDLKK